MRRRIHTMAAALLYASIAPGGCAAPPPVEEDPLQIQAGNAVDLLAARLSLAADEIEIVATERVTWPNGAAGCPRPGMSYTQALVDGYRVVLEANGREYHYHGVRNSQPFYCARPGPESG